MRWLIIALTCVAALSHAAAQDMPLSQVLIEGKGWKESSTRAVIGERRQSIESFPVELSIPGIKQPTCTCHSPDRGTIYVGTANDRYIWAFRVDKDDRLSAGQPYCSLRLPQGKKEVPVHSLAADSDGRIYAGTPLGVQVFDPTGRLCGVTSHPMPGQKIVQMLLGDGFLYMATEAMSYTRDVKTRGVFFGNKD